MITLPDYIITEEICEDNWLKIYRGYRVRDRSPVMIKAIQAGDNPADIVKLMNEYEVTRNLDIRGIIKPVQMEWAGLTVALIMEDNGDIPIRKYLQTGRPDLSTFLFIAMQLTEILGEVHKKGVIHRSLKLDNIFIHSGTGQIKIADFSMAALLSRKGQNDCIPPLAGTMAYMSPEQIGRMDKTVDQRSDFYSLGILLYEVLTGRLPLQADDHMQWVYAHMSKKPLSPREICGDIPQAVSAIIMKLLAKNPGERYQSAAGLLADLKECRQQWNQTGIIASLTLGRKDYFGLFPLSRKLYGREKEVAVLTAAFARACSGQAEIILIHGYAGTGKTVLISESMNPLVVERGYFITGKFDQLQRNIPYIPFIHALGNLMRQFLAESEERLAVWKRKFLHALGKNGALITEVIPEVALIIGPQHPVETLPPQETQNRFRTTFRNFMRVLAQKEHPLVVFLDDLQWAELASLELFQYLCQDTDSRYLLLIGAYRDDEVTAAHPLLKTLEELEKVEIPVRYLPLTPLSSDHIHQFVADTLRCTKNRAQPLVEILCRKAGGNPFFLGQLLQAAHKENLLRFNVQQGCWEWDLASIQEMPMADDIINFMLGKLQKLPEENRNVLQLAACIGNTFDLQTLSIVWEKTPLQTAADLHPSIVEGFVLFLNGAVDSEEKYEFLHDRVQQAACALVTAEETKEAHVRIGRLLLSNTDLDAREEKFFDILEHLNRGLELIKDPAERRKLAEYNLMAGRKAKALTAYSSALNYFKSGMELLPDQAWVECYRLTYDLHMERSLCEYLCDHLDEAEQLCDLLLSRARTDVERVDIYVNKLVFNSGRERYHETLQLGIQGLKLLGINLPRNPWKFTIIKEFLLAKWCLHSRNPDDFTNLPEMITVQKKAMTLLLAQAGAAAMTNTELFTLVMLKISNLAIKYNNAQYSSMGYACYSYLTGSVLGDYKTGHMFEKAALRLIEQHDNSAAKGIAFSLLGALVSHWSEHGKTSVSHLQKAVDYGLESGKVLVVGDALTMLIENQFVLGFSLQELYQKCENYYNRTKRVCLRNYQLLIANLIELDDGEASFGNGDYSDDNFTFLVESEMKTAMVYHVSKLQLYYLDGDYSNALNTAEQAYQNRSAIRGQMLSAEYVFYYSLAITAGYEGMPVKQQRKYWKILKKHQREMKKWSKSCPANFLHKYLLIAAEIARLRGKASDAEALYDQSIQSAREHGYVQNEAIAGEAATGFYMAAGRNKLARLYLIDACQGYEKWGAARKVRILQTKYSHLLTEISMPKEELKTAEILKKALQYCNGGDSSSTGNLDLYTLRDAVRKLSKKTDPDILLNSFLELAIKNVGADKGYLILNKDETLFIEAAKGINMHNAENAPIPLKKSVNLSQAIVRYVARTLDPVVVNDVEQAGIFARDSYIAHSRSKSIVCLPLLFQDIPVGVLYMENSLMTGVFTPDRVEVLQLLSSQIASVLSLQTFLAENTVSVESKAPPTLIEPLTERELEVLNLIAAGMSNQEIAEDLLLTINTVKSHIWNIYGKLQVNRRVQAISRARELKLLKK